MTPLIALLMAAPTELEIQVEAWRDAHALAMTHSRRCTNCVYGGLEGCDDGRALWREAERLEAVLPWRAEVSDDQ